MGTLHPAEVEEEEDEDKGNVQEAEEEEEEVTVDVGDDVAVAAAVVVVVFVCSGDVEGAMCVDDDGGSPRLGWLLLPQPLASTGLAALRKLAIGKFFSEAAGKSEMAVVADEDDEEEEEEEDWFLVLTVAPWGNGRPTGWVEELHLTVDSLSL